MRNAFDDFWNELKPWQKEGLEKVRKKYGNNRWWESNDPAVVVQYQSEEPWQVVSFPDYLDMLNQFLERPICHLDFAFNSSRIKEEVRSALTRNKLGIVQSEGQKEAARRDYIGRIETIVETQLPKDRVIKIDLTPKDEPSGYDGWLKQEQE